MTSIYQDNLAASEQHLERFAANTLPHFINGEAILSSSEATLAVNADTPIRHDAPVTSGLDGATFENYSPIDGHRLGTVTSGGTADVDRAATAAANAFPKWSALAGTERKRILHDVADLIEERADQIAITECVDTGQTIRFMKAAAVRGAANFRFFADQAPSAGDGQSLPATDHVNYTTRYPIGPVGVITPWNTPFMLSTWKIAPALASGCTVVHKPAEWSPYTAHLLAEIALEAGLPAGVLNVVHGLGETAGKALTEHPAIKALAFVGESSTGQLIQAQGAPTLKRLHFELGGKNPVIVFADADLDRALNAVIFMIYSLNGERCTSSSRVLIQESIYDEFTSRLADKVMKLRVGHPLDPASVIGPLIHQTHQQKVEHYKDVAADEGATVVSGTGWTDAPTNGCWVEPVLFTNATPDMQIAQEEIFGPALTALSFSDEADAVNIANAVEYGLAGYIWTGDVGRAHRVADALEVGMVWVNSQNVRHLPTPFGGTKQSGIGRDGGDWSFDFYMETKNISIALDTHSIPDLAG